MPSCRPQIWAHSLFLFILFYFILIGFFYYFFFLLFILGKVLNPLLYGVLGLVFSKSSYILETRTFGWKERKKLLGNDKKKCTTWSKNEGNQQRIRKRTTVMILYSSSV